MTHDSQTPEEIKLDHAVNTTIRKKGSDWFVIVDGEETGCLSEWEASLVDSAFRHAARIRSETQPSLSQRLSREKFEEIAQGWDGCEYDGGMIPDIGVALRRDFERLAAPAQAAPAVPEGRAKLRDAAISAARAWATTEHVHASNVGKGGPGNNATRARKEAEAIAAIDLLAAAPAVKGE